MKNRKLKGWLKVLLTLVSVALLLITLNNTYSEVYSFVNFIEGLLTVTVCGCVLTLVIRYWDHGQIN